MHTYMYDELSPRRERTLVGPTARDPIFCWRVLECIEGDQE